MFDIPASKMRMPAQRPFQYRQDGAGASGAHEPLGSFYDLADGPDRDMHWRALDRGKRLGRAPANGGKMDY
jgi:hypothetical protein